MANFVDNNKVKSGSGFSRRLDTDLDLFFFLEGCIRIWVKLTRIRNPAFSIG